MVSAFNSIDWMNFMYELCPNATTLILMNEKK
jgi:hypothetical protein